MPNFSFNTRPKEASAVALNVEAGKGTEEEEEEEAPEEEGAISLGDTNMTTKTGNDNVFPNHME